MKSDFKYWNEVLDRYRTSKTVRSLRKRFEFKELSELTGFSRQYIYGIQEMTIKPNREFIEKINQIKQ